MFSILPNLIARLKALVLTFIAADLEADLIAAAAQRKAELLRQGTQYEQDGLPTVAEQLRRQTEALSPDKPLSSVTAAIAHLQADHASIESADAGPPLPPAPQPPADPPPAKRTKPHRP